MECLVYVLYSSRYNKRYVEFFSSKKAAMQRESYLKSGSGREWMDKHLPNNMEGNLSAVG